MLKKSTLVLAAAAIMASTVAYAEPPRDVVRDERGQAVTSIGGCVRTKWQTPTDTCGRFDISRHERTVYFDFNRSTLIPSEKAKLDALIRAIKESKQVENVDVVGFADRIGSNDYNKRLSERRARTVRDYLGRSGVSTRNIRIEAMGETGSKTSCSDDMPRNELIACLAEDRRVEVQLNLR